MSYQSPSQIEQKTGIAEQDLIAAAKDIIWSYLKGERERLSVEPLITEFIRFTLETHPNPERMGCLGHTVLTQQMVSRDKTDEIFLKHLDECGPCLREYTEFLDTISVRK